MSEKLAIEQCVSCNSTHIKSVKGFYLLTVKGRALKIPGIQYYCCASCGERFMDADNSSKVDDFLRKRRKARAA